MVSVTRIELSKLSNRYLSPDTNTAVHQEPTLSPTLFEQRRRAVSLLFRVWLLDTSYAIGKADKNLLDGSFDLDSRAAKHR